MATATKKKTQRTTKKKAKTLFAILTDGYENARRVFEYTSNKTGDTIARRRLLREVTAP